jgi:DNA mismatch repair protein MutS
MIFVDGPFHYPEFRIAPGIGKQPDTSRCIDNTVSTMGARLLKRWLVFPLKDIQKINERLTLSSFYSANRIAQ